ncbi:hypothetical protein GOHSU_64_00010, partial [Gordonia hirsuta DSM 44140 = NBRC 16056]
MGPRTDWTVDASVILARIASMDPAGASADAAELHRIMTAAQAVGARLNEWFGRVDGLLGQGPVAADQAGLDLGARIADLAGQLAPAHQSLTAATADLTASQAVSTVLRAQVRVSSFSPGAVDALTRQAARVLDRVYSDPMSGRADGIVVSPPVAARR